MVNFQNRAYNMSIMFNGAVLKLYGAGHVKPHQMMLQSVIEKQHSIVCTACAGDKSTILDLCPGKAIMLAR
jgi:hypothetical protein